MNNKKCALFIMAPILSHIIPSTYLAELLEENHTIVYSVEDNRTKDYLLNTGYNVELINTERFGAGFDPIYLKKILCIDEIHISFWKASIFYFSNHLFKKRKAEFDSIIKKWNPSVIFIDIFSSTDFIILYKYYKQIKLIFISPMLPRYKNLMPQQNKSNLTYFSKKISTLDYFVELFSGSNPFLMRRYNYIKSLVWLRHKMYSDIEVIRFKGVDELILAPDELECGSDKTQDEYYLGLCVPTKNIQYNISNYFHNCVQRIQNEKKNGSKVLYCSFGTYFSSAEEFKAITEFLMALLDAIKLFNNTLLIISVNSKIEEIIRKVYVIDKNVSIFNFVDQLKMLKFCDAFITHGGLGSIKEAIHYNVPMLIYPLDSTWDQEGNATKVLENNLGLTGILRQDEPEHIYDKLNKLLYLHNTEFKSSVHDFNKLMKKKYGKNYFYQILNNCGYQYSGN